MFACYKLKLQSTIPILLMLRKTGKIASGSPVDAALFTRIGSNQTIHTPKNNWLGLEHYHEEPFVKTEWWTASLMPSRASGNCMVYMALGDWQHHWVRIQCQHTRYGWVVLMKTAVCISLFITKCNKLNIFSCKIASSLVKVKLRTQSWYRRTISIVLLAQYIVCPRATRNKYDFTWPVRMHLHLTSFTCSQCCPIYIFYLPHIFPFITCLIILSAPNTMGTLSGFYPRGHRDRSNQLQISQDRLC